jgi:poly(A)-specific ribonuclease
MDVTKENFFEILPKILKSISECDFLALDLEMTGLTSGKMERQKPWDSPQQRYTKVRDGAMAVCPTQFGLCTFKFNADSKSYEPTIPSFLS